MKEHTDENSVVSKLARELVLIERKSFYGSDPDNARLKKMRELIDKVSKEIRNDS